MASFLPKLTDNQVEFLADHLIAYRTLRSVYTNDDAPHMIQFWKTLMSNWYSLFDPEQERLYPGIKLADLTDDQLSVILAAEAKRTHYVQSWFRCRELIPIRRLNRRCAPRRIDHVTVYVRLYSDKVFSAIKDFRESLPAHLSPHGRKMRLYGRIEAIYKEESAVVRAVVQREADYLVMCSMAEIL